MIHPLRPDLAAGRIVVTAASERVVLSKTGKPVSRSTTGVRLHYAEVGALELPTGRIARSDPIMLMDQPPILRRTVASGRYPVLSVEAHARTERVVAFGAVVLSDQPASRYVLDDETSALGVDTGYASFTDASHLGTLIACYDGDAGLIRARCGASLGEHFDAAIVDLADGVPAAVWHSGFGDGVYDVYWGLDSKGGVCSVVVDFDVIANGLRGPAVSCAEVSDSLQS